MTLILSGDITLRRTWQPMDPDAAAYITAVETADGQALEEPVKIAIDNFVLGCKADGIWDAIKASCILAGARTLNGALVPLAGTAPTNNGFTVEQYNRKTGLKATSGQYLNANRDNSVDPQNSRHVAVYQTEVPSNDIIVIIGTTFNASRTTILKTGTTTARITANNGPSIDVIALGFLGGARYSATNVSIRNRKLTISGSYASEVPESLPMGVFANGSGGNACLGNRIAFYSIGESLDLAKLDARVTDLINKFAEVIP